MCVPVSLFTHIRDKTKIPVPEEEAGNAVCLCMLVCVCVEGGAECQIIFKRQNYTSAIVYQKMIIAMEKKIEQDKQVWGSVEGKDGCDFIFFP